MEVVLNVNDLKYKDIFNNISLSFEKGKIISISGANNCGKTTFCRILDRKVIDSFNINLMGEDIEDYKLEEYNHLVQVVYPMKSHFFENTPLEEMEREISTKEKKEFLKQEMDTFKITEKQINKLNTTEIILLEIIKAILKSNEIVVIDNMDQYISNKELPSIYEFIKRVIFKFKLTFIITTTSLEQALQTDELYVMKDGVVLLHGDPLTVLQNDNIINKAGLNVPFMIDLSVKLRDYELIKNVELNKERLIDTLWN